MTDAVCTCQRPAAYLTAPQLEALWIVCTACRVAGDAVGRWGWSAAGGSYPLIQQPLIARLSKLKLILIDQPSPPLHVGMWYDRQAFITETGRECLAARGAYYPSVPARPRRPCAPPSVALSSPMRAELLTRRALAVWSAHDQERT